MMDHKWHVEILSSLLVTEFEFTERYVILKTVLQFGSPLGILCTLGGYVLLFVFFRVEFHVLYGKVHIFCILGNPPFYRQSV